MDPIAHDHHARVLWRDLMSQVAALIKDRSAHPARTVVLVPYAQLMPLARAAWAAAVPDGFTPRFETTMNWAGGSGFVAEAEDISFDMARDLLTARAWLARAGLASRADLLAGRLVEVAWQLATASASVPPELRPGWVSGARPIAAAGADTPTLALEAALARIGLEWAGASRYATDLLFEPQLASSLELLVVLEGLRADPMAQALGRHLGERCVTLPLDRPAPAGKILLHEAADPSDEAEMTAACVVRHVEAGRLPVALGAIDRVLTRRVRAMLEAQGLSIRDETGWKLSTTRSAAQVMAALRACAWDADSDAVIDWLKNTPAVASWKVSALERRIRREGLRDWRSVVARAGRESSGWEALVAQAQGWREAMQAGRTLPQWLQGLRELLQDGGVWTRLERDAAGMQLVDSLGLDELAQARWESLPQAARRMTLLEFSAWVSAALEAASFRPDHPEVEQVVILPFPQVLARPFAALVLAGCDEVRLAASPEPEGLWTAAQREQLGLPLRTALEAQLRAGWRSALQTPHVDVLWRRSDEAGEPVLASTLVQALVLQGGANAAADPRGRRELPAAPVTRPLPAAGGLAVETLSASAYEDLRHCPYRFHALRQLGLQEVGEIDSDLDKRDFGNWLHRVLSRFHEELRDSGQPPDAAHLERAAQQVTREMGLLEGEFLPFAAAWPAARDGYLAWLAGFSAAQGATFESAETEHARQLGPVRLIGRIDRIDRLPDGRRFVMDYKTEARTVTAERVKQPGEDTQLAFYAALLGDDSLRAGYVNISEREGTKLLEQPEVIGARDLLVAGIQSDLRQLAEGAPLQALGEGKVCGFCAARGICRRDFWSS